MAAIGADDKFSLVLFRITGVYPEIQSDVGPLEPRTVDVLMDLTAQAQIAESQLRSSGHSHNVAPFMCRCCLLLYTLVFLLNKMKNIPSLLTLKKCVVK